jgi:predicted membrane protein
LNLGNLYFDIVSTARCPVENFVLRISYFASLGISTAVERSLQIRLFMQNKANFLDALMNVSTIITKDYENIANSKLGENKPKTNPKRTQIQKGQK